MPEAGLQERSERLAARVDALAAALHECGVPDEEAFRLLGHASTAVLQALTLELLFAPAAPEPAAAPAGEPRRERSLPLAA
ncbi:MAG TPA: hypothetical protein VKR79_07785 [Gaiellaceae bacterium]|nr:hypothetical protein [Gaiellaceae bacterium]